MLEFLKEKAKFVRIATLKIAQSSPEIRLASSLSPVEIFSALYYGKLLNYDNKIKYNTTRDRFIVSKGHGSISLYPILADLGFFSQELLKNVGKKGNFLGSIPDPIIPGYETINGSLGHGLGVGAGISFALKMQKNPQNVVVLVGDGELNEGSNWEAVMFSAQHKLENLTLIVDYNKISMLDYSKNIIDLNPLRDKFESFGWFWTEIANGHDVAEVYQTLKETLPKRIAKPKVVVANTIKGKGVVSLETNSLCHILTAKPEEITQAIREIENEA